MECLLVKKHKLLIGKCEAVHTTSVQGVSLFPVIVFLYEWELICNIWDMSAEALPMGMYPSCAKCEIFTL